MTIPDEDLAADAYAAYLTVLDGRPSQPLDGLPPKHRAAWLAAAAAARAKCMELVFDELMAAAKEGRKTADGFYAEADEAGTDVEKVRGNAKGAGANAVATALLERANRVAETIARNRRAG